jgi:hypothetical protein
MLGQLEGGELISLSCKFFVLHMGDKNFEDSNHVALLT